MLPVLEFIFSSFWTWLGSVILLWTLAMGFAASFSAMRGKP